MAKAAVFPVPVRGLAQDIHAGKGAGNQKGLDFRRSGVAQLRQGSQDGWTHAQGGEGLGQHRMISFVTHACWGGLYR